MLKLLEHINDITFNNTNEIQKSIVSMVCDGESPIGLSVDDLLNALKFDGEFLVLNLNYSDFAHELESQKIMYKISQALSVIIRYEDDGTCFEDIKKFVTYVHDISDAKQNSTFGVKKVDKLSKYPITILFSGILPINQLSMTVGKKVYELIHSDDEYFIPRFKEFRDTISQEVGIPILPVFPALDNDLSDYEVNLTDMYDGRRISKFEVQSDLDKKTIEIYLLKLFYIYKTLVADAQVII